MARREPITAPVTFAAPKINPSCQIIAPFKPKIIIAPTFVETFTTFAIADAVMKAYPRDTTNINIRNDPVPGPKIPS